MKFDFLYDMRIHHVLIFIDHGEIVTSTEDANAGSAEAIPISYKEMKSD